MANPPRGNDALSSWSGYNYQGKVTILQVLMIINQKLANGENLDKVSVEIEKKEDFVIYENNVAKSFNQVKATLSKKTWAGYTSAVNKLEEYRNSTSFLTAQLKLFSAAHILNWENESNINKDKAELFMYEGEHVGLLLVKDKIILELNKFEQYKNLNYSNVNIIYLEICEFLCENVSKIHQFGRNSSYKIPFEDFVERIEVSVNKVQENINGKIKEMAYEFVTKEIFKALNQFCSDPQCGLGFNECQDECGIKKHYDYLLNIDFFEYCRILNPNIIDGWENIFKFSQKLDDAKYKEYILAIYQNVFIESIYNEDSLMYFESEHGETESNKIIPTMMDLTAHETRVDNNIQKALDDIKRNDRIINRINNCTITANTKKKVLDIIEDSINPYKKKKEISQEIDKPRHRITDGIGLNVKIIDRDELINKLRSI